MKILLLGTHINVGGIGIYIVSLARYLKRSGVDVTVISSGGELERVLENGQIPHRKIDIQTRAEFGIKVWKALPDFLRLVKDENFDLIHAQTRVAQVLSCLSQKLTGVPFITTCHGFFNYKRLGRRIFPCWGDRVIAISRNVMAHLIHDFNVPADMVRLVYNGIEIERFTERASLKNIDLVDSLGLKPGKITVGTVGRLSSVKGYKFLIEAFKEVIMAVPDTQLLLVGKGPEEKPLADLAGKLGISGNVFFDNGEKALVEDYLALMDVFCLPSLAEGLGLSLMEAMASGCACIASDIGGLSELIVSNEDGVLVPPSDPRQISDAVIRLLKDPGLRRGLSKKGRDKAAQHFSIRDSVASTMEVYKEVIERRS